MTFDLYAFPAPGPANAREAHQLMGAEEERLIGDIGTELPPPSPKMTRFLDELQRRWPSLEDDPDGSPWSSWPLWQPMVGGGTGLNIGWSYADSMRPAILEIAARTNVTIYDPQADQVIRPSPHNPIRRLFKRSG